jgi:uncharacterized protein (DUF885 family)
VRAMILAVTFALGTTTPIANLSAQYLRELWGTSPMTATQAGYHQGGADLHLDDLSADARHRRSEWLREFAARLDAALPGASDEDAADGALMRDAVALERLELDEAHDYARRCDAPLDALGNVFFQMISRPAGRSPETLAAHVRSRLGDVPRYLEQVRAGLAFSVDAFREAAKDDGAGLIDYFQHDLTAAFPKDQSLRPAIAAAVAAVQKYLAFVDKDLPKLPTASFRVGAALYDKRFRPYLQTDRAPADVLAAAEARVKELHADMRRLALVVDPKGAGDIRAALGKVAADHPKPEALFETARKDVDEARRFVIEQQLLTLEKRDNLRVIETPAFMRSQLGVAAFDGAPPLEPEAGAFYYVTPFPPDWPAAKVDAKLREYNRYMLALITIHEAMPGHYVQFERASSVEPETRRVLRWILSSNAYVEGWAVYAQDLMVDAGFWGGDPRLKLTEAKLELRAVVNAILDIKLQTTEFSDAQALALLMDTAFQERPEAELKLRRAKLSVTQLCSYFVGGEAWRALRKEAASAPGFNLRAFHDRALGEGAVTLPTLRKLLGPH